MEGTVLVKITESELKGLITVLREFTDDDVDEGFKMAYKVLLTDFMRIQNQMNEKKEDIISSEDEYYAEKVCEECE